jgi:hypothetical protein
MSLVVAQMRSAAMSALSSAFEANVLQNSSARRRRATKESNQPVIWIEIARCAHY